MATSLDLLLSVGDAGSLARVLEKAKTSPFTDDIVSDRKKKLRMLAGKAICGPTPIVPDPFRFALPKENPEAFHRIGQVQVVEDCTCLRCGNRWDQFGELLDSFRRITPDKQIITMQTPATVRFNATPTREIVPVKKINCLACFAKESYNGQ